MAAVDPLTGARVTLRAPRPDDAEVLFERVTSDPVVTRYLSWPTHPDVAETRRVITEVFNVGTDRTWLVEHGGDGVVGMCGYRRPVRHIVEFGYCLAHGWWGRGLMTEAVRMMIDVAARDPRVYRIAAICHVDNGASAALLRRCGLRLEGRLARHTVFPAIGPEPLDVLLFARAVR
ncbi:GNAT family N-acetyltransferase [uncultured Mycolicibacterium sp.]|uniref:GNAT family N-acetyltransferase n=1 Tax=uncultured Mycolicibacterium sp. TaxID=2320817 RepID=UPI00260CB8CB|nr:GNAT family N-acetyltransferase [uncultured Mycolicibacterium sp.]